MKQLDGAGVGGAHHGIVDDAIDRDGSERNGGVVDALGERDDVGREAEIFAGRGSAEPAEAGDDFVKNEQQSMAGADRVQPLQIATRGHQHAG
jgi:hypothetical protein